MEEIELEDVMPSISTIIWTFRLNYFDFSGRTSRSAFWQQLLAMCGIQLAISLLMIVVGAFAASQPANSPLAFVFLGLGILLVLVALLFIIPFYSLCSRRLHDTGHSAKWAFWMIPFGIFAFLLLCFLFAEKGNSFENKYGPPPNRSDDHVADEFS